MIEQQLGKWSDIRISFEIVQKLCIAIYDFDLASYSYRTV